MRSRKSKGQLNGGPTSNTPPAVSSPTKRRTRNSDVIGDVIATTDNKKPIVDLPQSSKDLEKENIDESNKIEVKTNDDVYVVQVEEKYVPPPPLPFTLQCPDPDCRKGFRHPNGLRYHVSNSHPEISENESKKEDVKVEMKTKEEKLEMEAKEEVKDESTYFDFFDNFDFSKPIPNDLSKSPSKTEPSLFEQEEVKNEIISKKDDDKKYIDPEKESGDEALEGGKVRITATDE